MKLQQLKINYKLNATNYDWYSSEDEILYILLEQLDEKKFRVLHTNGTETIVDLNKVRVGQNEYLVFEIRDIEHNNKQKWLVECLKNYSQMRNQMIVLENLADYLNKLT